jgi:hypothetical protein
MLRAQVRVSGAGATKGRKRLVHPFDDSPPKKAEENLKEVHVEKEFCPDSTAAKKNGKVSFNIDT